MIFEISRKSQISKIKIELYHIKDRIISNNDTYAKSSSGEIYWIENHNFKTEYSV